MFNPSDYTVQVGMLIVVGCLALACGLAYVIDRVQVFLVERRRLAGKTVIMLNPEQSRLVKRALELANDRREDLVEQLARDYNEINDELWDRVYVVVPETSPEFSCSFEINERTGEVRVLVDRSQPRATHDTPDTAKGA